MVEKTIEALLPEGRFVPSESFRKLAHFRDKRVYDEAARHPEAFWASIARDRPHPQSGHEVAAGELPCAGARGDRRQPVRGAVHAPLAHGVVPVPAHRTEPGYHPGQCRRQGRRPEGEGARQRTVRPRGVRSRLRAAGPERPVLAEGWSGQLAAVRRRRRRPGDPRRRHPACRGARG